MNTTTGNTSLVEQCKACVDGNATWCQVDEFFGSQNNDQGSGCVSNATSGFFGDCSDFAFGSHNYQSGLDCTFNSENGEVILAVIVIASLMGLMGLAVAARCKRRARSNRTSQLHVSHNVPVQHLQPQQQQMMMMPQQQQMMMMPQQQQQQGTVLGFVATQQQPVIVGGQAPIVQAVPVPVPVYAVK
jgi:hypothetical protein